MADITLTVEFKDKDGTKHVKKMVGSYEELAKKIEQTGRFIAPLVKGTRNAQVAASQLKKEFNKSAESLKKTGGQIRIVASETQKLGKITKKWSKARKMFLYKDDKGKFSNAKAHREAKLREKQIKLEVKAKRHLVKTNAQVARSMRKIVMASKQKAMNAYTTQIKQMREQMKRAGYSVDQTEEHLKDMITAFQKLKSMNVDKIVAKMQGRNMGVDEAGTMAGRIGARNKPISPSMPAGGPPMSEFKSTMGSIGKTLSMFKTQAAGAVGFTMIDVGTRLQQAFSQKRLAGQLAGASSNIAGAVGDVFGSAVGSVTRDIGKFVGTIGEVLVNLMTFTLRTAMSSLGGVIKAFGYTVASGMVGAILGSLVAPGPGTAIGFAMTALMGFFLAGVQSGFAIIAETVGEIVDILSKALTAVTALLSAGFKVIGGIIGAGVKIIFVMWKKLWNGIVEFTKTAVQKVLMMLSKFASSAIKTFAQVEKQATKAAKEIADVYGTDIVKMQALIGKTAARSGKSLADSARATFDVVSSGFRTMAEANKILSAASKLAILDQTTLANATNALITVWRNYEGKIKNVATVAKILATATSLGRTELSEMGPAMKLIIPTASRFGLSLRDTMETMAALTQIFGRGSTSSAARYFNRALEGLFLPSSRASKALAKLGIDVKKLQSLAEKGKTGQALYEMFEKLSKLPLKDVRKVFPTIQARRFTQITSKLHILKKVTADFQSVMKKGLPRQYAMGMKLWETVIGRISNVLQSAKARVGELLVSVIKFMVFNKAMARLWMRLNDLIFSKWMTKRVRDFASGIKNVLLPAAQLLRDTFAAVVRVVAKLKGGTLFEPGRIKSIQKSFSGIVNSVIKIFDKMKIGENSALIFKTAMWAVEKSLKGIDSMLDKLVNDPAALFGDAKGLWNTIKKQLEVVVPLAMDYIHAKFDEMLIGLGVLIGGFDFNLGDFGISDSLKNTIDLVIINLKIGFLQAVRGIAKPLFEMMRDSANPFAEAIMKSVRVIWEVLKVMKSMLGTIASMMSKIGAIYNAMFPAENIPGEKRKLAIYKEIEKRGLKVQNVRGEDVVVPMRSRKPKVSMPPGATGKAAKDITLTTWIKANMPPEKRSIKTDTEMLANLAKQIKAIKLEDSMPDKILSENKKVSVKAVDEMSKKITTGLDKSIEKLENGLVKVEARKEKAKYSLGKEVRKAKQLGREFAGKRRAEAEGATYKSTIRSTNRDWFATKAMLAATMKKIGMKSTISTTEKEYDKKTGEHIGYKTTTEPNPRYKSTIATLREIQRQKMMGLQKQAKSDDAAHKFAMDLVRGKWMGIPSKMLGGQDIERQKEAQNRGKDIAGALKYLRLSDKDFNNKSPEQIIEMLIKALEKSTDRHERAREYRERVNEWVVSISDDMAKAYNAYIVN